MRFEAPHVQETYPANEKMQSSDTLSLMSSKIIWFAGVVWTTATLIMRLFGLVFAVDNLMQSIMSQQAR